MPNVNFLNNNSAIYYHICIATLSYMYIHKELEAFCHSDECGPFGTILPYLYLKYNKFVH